MKPPRTSYIVCATPRSGSGLLCEALWNTELAGRPNEYFYREDLKRWGASSYAEYIDAVIENGTTPNGVFGVKLMWDQIRYLRIKIYLRAPQFAKFRLPALLGSLFPNPHYIWLTRRDKLKQAVSFYRALETRSYRSPGDAEPRPKAPEFHFRAIDRVFRKLHKWDASWRNYFDKHRISPLVVVYEDDLEQGYQDISLRILEYLKIPVPPDLAFHASRRKQSDELSEAFVRLYQETRRRKKRRLE
jgi:LPS sulfotransferase NodH